jgi:hypothetical protein
LLKFIGEAGPDWKSGNRDFVPKDFYSLFHIGNPVKNRDSLLPAQAGNGSNRMNGVASLAIKG